MRHSKATANIQRTFVFLIVLSLATGLTGCAKPQEPTGRDLVLHLGRQASEAGYDSQAEVLADGVVEAEEYDEAIREARSCLTERGIAMTEPQLNPADGLIYLFEMDAGGLSMSAFEEEQAFCLDSRLHFVESAYVATTPKIMFEPLRIAAIECMKNLGYSVSGSEKSFADLAGEIGEGDTAQENDAADCITDEAIRIYPDLKMIGISR